MVTDSVVVFAVRPGNPENIQTWDDLIKEGVEVITPNPFTSGGAQWNIMAAYGAQLEQGKSDEEAIEYLRELFINHVPVQDKSAREALQTFAGGKGDVMLAYENEAIFAQQAGQALEYVVPDETILIENPVAVVNTSEHPEAAQAFVDFLYTPEAQAVFAAKGYRPVVDGRRVASSTTPTRRTSSRSRTSAAGRTSASASSTARRASSSTSRTSSECPLTTSTEAVELPARTGSSRRAGGLRSGALDRIPHAHRPHPDRGGRRRVARGRALGVLGRRDRPPRRSRRSSSRSSRRSSSSP